MSVINTYILLLLCWCLRGLSDGEDNKKLRRPSPLVSEFLWKVHISLYTHLLPCVLLQSLGFLCICVLYVLFSFIPLACNKQFLSGSTYPVNVLHFRKVQSRYIRCSYPVVSQAKRSTINYGCVPRKQFY